MTASLSELEKATRSLQREVGIIRSAHVYAGSVLESYSELQNRFDSDARIVHTTLFEARVLVIQEHSEELKDEEEKRLCR